MDTHLHKMVEFYFYECNLELCIYTREEKLYIYTCELGLHTYACDLEFHIYARVCLSAYTNTNYCPIFLGLAHTICKRKVPP